MKKYIEIIKNFLNPPPPKPHVHNFEFFHENRHFWDRYTDGTNRGMYCEIDFAIEVVSMPKYQYSYDLGQQNELNNLLNWQKQGFTGVYTNLRWYKCSCGKHYFTEYHTEPFVVTKKIKEKGRAAIEQVVKLVC